MTLSVNHHGTGLRLGMKRSFSEIQGCYRFLYGEDWACPATWCHMGTNGYGENSFENFKTVFIHQYVSRITSSVSEQLSRRWKEPPRHISKTQKIPLVVPDANSVKESSRKNINHPICGMQVQSHGLDLILEMYCFASFMEMSCLARTYWTRNEHLTQCELTALVSFSWVLKLDTGHI